MIYYNEGHVNGLTFDIGTFSKYIPATIKTIPKYCDISSNLSPKIKKENRLVNKPLIPSHATLTIINCEPCKLTINIINTPI